MEVSAKLNHLRIAPRKVRLVVDLIRGKKATEAETILNFTVKKASLPVSKLLKQGIANAKNNFQIDVSNLFVSKIKVDEGPKQKRWRARSRGQTYGIQKKTSHITLILDEIKKSTKKKTKKVVEKKPVVEEISGKIREEKAVKTEKSKFKPIEEIKKYKAEKGGGLRKMFRRKAL